MSKIRGNLSFAKLLIFIKTYYYYAYNVEGVWVRIYNPAKTVADCSKYRNMIGLDVAIEALREAIRERRCSTDELWRYAKICRVAKIIRPYMEAIA
jgi:hypothetical protein